MLVMVRDAFMLFSTSATASVAARMALANSGLVADICSAGLNSEPSLGRVNDRLEVKPAADVYIVANCCDISSAKRAFLKSYTALSTAEPRLAISFAKLTKSIFCDATRAIEL